MTRLERLIDAVLAAALCVAFSSTSAAIALAAREEVDTTIGYMLPAANFVVRGRLDVAQLGSQFGFDRFWLFNAPLLVFGPVVAFLVAGVGRLQYAGGVAVLAVVNLIVFAVLCRRLLSLRGSALATLIAIAFLGSRGLFASDLYMQRYSVLAFAMVLFAFAPGRDATSGGLPTRSQSFVAAILPLAHPTLILASVVFAIALFHRARRDTPHPIRRWTRGPVLAFVAGTALSAVWWCRPHALVAQLLPHARFQDFREGQSLEGLLHIGCSPLMGVPTRALMVVTVFAAGLVIVRARRIHVDSVHVVGALPAAAVVLLLLPVDAWHGFIYYQYLLIGLGPVLIGTVASFKGLRTATVVGLALIAVANMYVSFRVDRDPLDWTTTDEARAFTKTHTRAGDRLVLGPPFVLVAATGVDGRTVDRVVPETYKLEHFDGAAFFNDIAERSDVYIGRPEWFRRPTSFDIPRATVAGPSLRMFPDASIERYEFAGEPIIVARRRTAAGAQ